VGDELRRSLRFRQSRPVGDVGAENRDGLEPCRRIHKSVEWSLPADVDLIVQITGAGAREHAKLAVTAVPAS